MHFLDETRDRVGEAVLHGGLGRLLLTVSHSLFGSGAAIDRPRPPEPLREANACRPADDDMGWLSLSSDADGHSIYEGDVICMGVTPDDLDVHDSDGGDLSWIGLSPVHPVGRNGPV
jgi:hypothetical protein